jgi:hypothetical protein
MPARIVALVAAAVLGLVSLGLLAAGGGLLWADSKRDDDGYISTGRDPFEAEYRESAGSRRPAAPPDERFWVASAQGAGDQTLTWDVEHGNWSVVVMNADATRGVDVELSAGAEVPFLEPAGLRALIAGLVTFSLAALLAVLGIRSGRHELAAA